MSLARILALALALFAMPIQAAQLIDPPPVSIPPGTTPEHVVKAIKRALIGLTFTVDNESPGRIDAKYAPRTHVAKVAVTYDASQVLITYVDSTNLNYKVDKDGKREIHRNYNRWMNNLAIDISKFLTAGDF